MEGSTTTYAYDNADRVTGLATTQGAATLGAFGYAYSRHGQVTQATEAIDGTTRTVGYSYDGLRRLVGSTVSFGAGGGATTYGYAYDLAGNRTAATVNGATVQSRSYDAADQAIGWTYDNAGNLLNDGAQGYTWDPLGRLASATAGGVTVSYAYTGEGHLFGQTSSAGGGTQYILDPAGALVERLGALTTPAGGGAATAAWYVRGWGQELRREGANGASPAWYLADRLGSVRAEYDNAGTAGPRLDYDPFGQPEAGAGRGTPADYGYAGEPRDGASGLVQLRARWYAPDNGRFASRDPWAGDPATPQTLAPYAYAHNDPANGTDPSGWCFDYASMGQAAVACQGTFILGAVGAAYAGGSTPPTTPPAEPIDILELLEGTRLGTAIDIAEVVLPVVCDTAVGMLSGVGEKIGGLFGWNTTAPPKPQPLPLPQPAKSPNPNASPGPAPSINPIPNPSTLPSPSQNKQLEYVADSNIFMDRVEGGQPSELGSM